MEKIFKTILFGFVRQNLLRLCFWLLGFSAPNPPLYLLGSFLEMLSQYGVLGLVRTEIRLYLLSEGITNPVRMRQKFFRKQSS